MLIRITNSKSIIQPQLGNPSPFRPQHSPRDRSLVSYIIIGSVDLMILRRSVNRDIFMKY